MFPWRLVTQVRLYMDCEEYHRVAFSRSPRPLTFEAGSGIFVGNAGGTGLTRFVVSLMPRLLVSVIPSRLGAAALRIVPDVTRYQTWRLDFGPPSLRDGNNSIPWQLYNEMRGGLSDHMCL